MPYLKDLMERARGLAEGPTLGNLHPDARAQAIARAGIADAEAMALLPSAADVGPDGYVSQGNHD